MTKLWRLIALTAVAAFAATATAADVHITKSFDLPVEYYPHDVRWLDDHHVVIAAGYRAGAVRFDITTGMVRSEIEGKSRDRWVSDLAIANGRLVYAGPIGPLGWTSADGSSATVAFASPNDIDASGDEVAVFGTQRDAAGRYAPEGAIGWLGTIRGSGVAWRPFLFSEAGAGARPFAYCKMLELGALRFLPDGSLVVVPGIQPGIFRYDRNGKLIESWPSGQLGFVDRCTISQDLWQAAALNLEPRRTWINEHVVLDEILPLPAPALVIRRREKTQTRWDLVELLPHQQFRRSTLPVTSSSPFARLHGDVRNGRVVLLVSDDEPPDTGVHPQLFIGTVTP